MQNEGFVFVEFQKTILLYKRWVEVGFSDVERVFNSITACIMD